MAKTPSRDFLVLFFLKFRILLLFILLLICANSFYLINLVVSTDKLRYLYFNLSSKYEIICRIITNVLLLIDGRVALVLSNLLSGISLLLLIFIIVYAHEIICGRIKIRKAIKTLLLFFVLNSAIFIFIRVYVGVSFFSAVLLTSIVLLQYYIDFGVFINSGMNNNRGLRRPIFYFFSLFIFFSEIIFTVHYLKFILAIEGKKIGRSLENSLQYCHFSIIIISLLAVVAPLRSGGIIEMHNIRRGEFYDIKFSPKNNSLFVLNHKEGRIENLHLTEKGYIPSTVYDCCDYDNKEALDCREFIGEDIAIDDERSQLYCTDRGRERLIVLDINDYSVKGLIHSKVFNKGDNIIVPGGKYLFGVTEADFCVYRASRSAFKISGVRCLKAGEGSMVVFNEKKNLLYATNWKRSKDGYYIFEIEPADLKVLRKIKLSTASWAGVSDDGEKLYCLAADSSFRFRMYIFDAVSLALIDKINVPIGARHFVIDDKNSILFVGSTLTNLVEAINLNTKEIIRIYRAGNYSLRRLALDTKNRRVFASTQHFGIFEASY